MKTGEVIRKRRMEKGLTQKELATMMGYTSPSTINKIESGRIDITQKKVKEFAEVLGIEIGDLFPDIPLYDSTNGMLTIPFINQKLSAGPGEDYLSPDAIEVRKINVFAHVAKGLDRKTLVAAEVRGDSMIGENISSGDVVIFSRGLINQEGIYVINYAGDINIKRLDFDGLTNKVSIISANPKYPTKVVDADCVTILGKVVGLIHAFDF